MASVAQEDDDIVTPAMSCCQLEDFLGTMDSVERLEYQVSTVQDVLKEIQLLSAKTTLTRADSALRVLTPFISFIDRYSAAVDMMAQNFGSPSCLIWGCLRVILRVAQSVPFYFKDLLRLVECFGSQLYLYGRFDRLFLDRQEFMAALFSTYMDAIIFLTKARDALRANCSVITWLRRAWMSFEQEFEEISQRLKRRLQYLDRLSTFIHRDTMREDRQKQEEFRVQATLALDDKLNAEILSWLSPANYHEDWRRNLEKCIPRTCRWIFDHPFFHTWVQSETPNVGWVTGSSGMGKTVLCSSVIDKLESDVVLEAANNTAVAYFFFDGTDESHNSTLAMYRAILSQLMSKVPSCTECIHAVFEVSRKYGRSHMAWSDGPASLLKEALAMLTQSYVVLDGLDECKDIDIYLGELLDVLQSSNKCCALLLSRDVPCVRDKLVERDVLTLRMPLDLIQSDIKVYFTKVIEELGIPVQEGERKTDLLSQLSTGADGMFLWAHFMAEELKSAICVNDVYEAAATIPGELSLYYNLALKRLEQRPHNWVELARKVFSRVLCSPRPLSWAELQCSLSFGPDEAPGSGAEHKGRLPYKSAVLKICQPFIEYHPGADYFRPAHSSVHHFLTSAANDSVEPGLRIYLPEANQKIAKILLNYINELGTWGYGATDSVTYPLLDYATSYWCHHLIHSQIDVELCKKAKFLLSSDMTRRTWLTRWLLMNREAFPLPEIFRVLGKVRNLLEEHAPDDTFCVDDLQDIVMILLTVEEERIRTRSAPDWSTATMAMSKSDRIMVIRDLARVYKMTNRLEDGIYHFESGKRRLEQVARAQQEDSVWILNGLGILYDQQGQIEHAVATQQRALVILSASQQSNEFEKILTVNELGRLYRHLQKFSESQEMHLQALETLQDMLPDTDIQIIWTKSHLAKCYRMEGQLHKALKLHDEVLLARRQLVGFEHPHTLWDLSDLAKCHRDLGNLDEACRLQEMSVNLRQKVLGPSHHDTLWAMNDLGVIYERARRLDEALHVHLKAWEQQKLTLGVAHEATVWSLREIDRLKMLCADSDVSPTPCETWVQVVP